MILLLLFLGIGAAVAYYYNFENKRAKIRAELELVVKRKREDTNKSIEKARKSADKVDEKTRNYIGSLDFEQLREALQNGSITCLDTVRTYYHKAIIAHEKTNAVTMFIEESEKWAEEWDEKAKQERFVKPSMFGIPISLKECVMIKGYDNTRGFVQDAYHPATKDAIQVQHFKKLGMIPFCQTNVPQSLLTYNCCNPVFGTTTHPLDKTRTCGGSSGGEAALLGADGSILGIGGDVGGSVRIPCHFTGTVGIKPAKARFAHRGAGSSVPGKPMIDANDGPMAKDVKTNVEFLRSVWGDTFQSDADPYCPPVLFNEELYNKKNLRIGYYLDDGWFTPTPAIQRSVLEAKAHLEAAGHTVIPFYPPRMADVMTLYYRAVCLDGGQYILKKLLKDLIEPTITFQVTLWMVPLWVQKVLSYPVSFIFPRMAILMRAMTRDTFVLREAYAGIEGYREEFMELMIKDKLDALICPSQIMPAPQHHIPSKLVSGINYTCLFNLLDFGAGVVPVTTVNKEDEEKLIREYPETDKWYITAKESTKGAIGMPIGVQVAAPPYREEIVLRVMRDIEIAVTGN